MTEKLRAAVDESKAAIKDRDRIRRKIQMAQVAVAETADQIGQATNLAMLMILGEDEVKSNKVTVKPLRGGEQRSVELEPAIALISRNDA